MGIRTRAVLATAMLMTAMRPLSAEDMPTFKVISPIFSQLVAFSMPARFVTVFENTSNGHYTREAVPKGENTERWTEMITVTGEKGVSGNAEMTPEKFAGSIAGGFKRACPDSFAANPLGARKFGDADAFVSVIGCGKVGDHSETALIAVVKGSADYYTIQWAERGDTMAEPPVKDAKWTERLARLQPIAVCPIVPGEAAPYPSCIGKNKQP
jgi:hypothetical protein